MTRKLKLLFTILLLTLTLSHSRLTRPESSSTGSYSDQLKKNSKDNTNNKNDNGYGFDFGPPASGLLGPGEGNGGSSIGPIDRFIKGLGGIMRPTVVCKEKGHCHNKKLTCPAKCFWFGGRSGKGYGGGGGGGGCTMDCKKCVAYC
ncbi:hypothetical protein V5N11_028936 [Cardamine amara subsp. amara]|uniref:Uncharacterized protein n=1 Tax=Cardamine amara subsp. amara TaxID=228776 RepID=A0ABD1BHM4_CARAN